MLTDVFLLSLDNIRHICFSPWLATPPSESVLIIDDVSHQQYIKNENNYLLAKYIILREATMIIPLRVSNISTKLNVYHSIVKGN